MSAGYTPNRPQAAPKQQDAGAVQQVQNIVYYKADGSPDAGWVDKKASEQARILASSAPLTTTQLRKFYADVKNSERIWEYENRSDEAFHRILPQIKILKAKAAYAKKRNAVSVAFERWLCKHIDAIKKPKDFEVFLLHFEAVVGFCYGEGLKD